MGIKTLKDIERKAMLINLIPFVTNPFSDLNEEIQWKNFMVKHIKNVKEDRDEEIRKEAIKHIKQLDKKLFCECGKHLKFDEEEGALICKKCDIVEAVPPEYDKIEWIKYFFNIKEKDLK